MNIPEVNIQAESNSAPLPASAIDLSNCRDLVVTNATFPLSLLEQSGETAVEVTPAQPTEPLAEVPVEPAEMKDEELDKAIEQIDKCTHDYTVEQLQMAFDNVKHPDDWKNPIDILIDDPGEKNLDCLYFAIIYFTGTIPEYSNLEVGKIHVRAAGYYSAENEVQNPEDETITETTSA